MQSERIQAEAFKALTQGYESDFVCSYLAQPKVAREVCSFLLIFSTYAYPKVSFELISRILGIIANEGPEKPGGSGVLKERLEACRRLHEVLNSRPKNPYGLASLPSNGVPIYCLTTQNTSSDLREGLGLIKEADSIKFIAGVTSVPNEFRSNIKSNSLSEGAICCAFGHRMILKRIVREGHSLAVILEDDAILRGDFSVLAALKRVDMFDVLFIENRITPAIGSDYDVKDKYAISPVLFGCGTAGYVVTLDGARKLLEVLENIYDAADIQILAAMEPPFSTRIEHWARVRGQMKLPFNLKVRRLVPFLVDHPPYNFSKITGRYRANYTPGLWLQEP